MAQTTTTNTPNTTPRRFTGQIHLLCEESKWQTLESLLPQTPPSSLTERQGWNQWTPLMISCVRAPLSTITSLIKSCPSSVTIPDRSHSLPLHFVACWRRPASGSTRSVATTEEEFLSILRLLLEYGGGECVTSVNTWGQTPLHSAFDSDKDCIQIEAVMILLGIEEEGEEVEEGVMEALSMPDSKSRLPIHIAAEKCCGNASIVGLLAECCPRSCGVATKEGDLAVHLFGRGLGMLPEPMEEEEEEEIGHAMGMLLGDLAPSAMKLEGSVDKILPLHIAAEYGVDYATLAHLLENYPESASVPREYQGHSVFPIELFDLGRAGKKAKEIKKRIQTQAHLLSNEERQILPQILDDFYKRSDLIFAYYPEAIPTFPGSALYRKDPMRLARLEGMIRSEAKAEGDLSQVSRLVWTWMCQYSNGERDNYSANVGRIISNLDSTSLWKLTFVKTHKSQQGQFVKVLSGKTVVLEAEERAPNTKMEDMWQHRWFFPSVLEYLEGRDAILASMCCKIASKQGVKSLMELDGSMKSGSWDLPPDAEFMVPPQPWQRVELVVPECTHSFLVKYTHEGEGGGLLIVRNDGQNVQPNDTPPWGEAVLASPPLDLNPAHSSSPTTLSVTHTPGRTYGLWYFLSASKLLITSVRIRQILYLSDQNNRSPLQILLNRTRPPPRLNEKINLLLQSNFPIHKSDESSSLFLHHALRSNVDATTLSLLITSSPTSLLDTDKDQRTPLHASFLLSSTPPSPTTISALLQTPGENALKLKDATGRLPLHIAAERGASPKILSLLVSPYPDSCYRVNKDGDLPLHLLIRSGNATRESIEMVLKPMMSSSSIVKIKGSGEDALLPLHIACEYNVDISIMEQLLKSFPEGAAVRRGCDKLHPLEILERHRLPETKRSKCTTEELDAKSDLLFVHYPLLAGSGIPPRLNETRITRLANMITRELLEHQSQHPGPFKPYLRLSLTSRMAWIFLTTTSPQIAEDEILPTETSLYHTAVESILRKANSAEYAEYLAKIRFHNISIEHLATPEMRNLILGRVRFCGRYELLSVKHKSFDSLVLQGKDYNLQEEYEKILSKLRDMEEVQEKEERKIMTWDVLEYFGKRLGVNEKGMKKGIKQIQRGNHRMVDGLMMTGLEDADSEYEEEEDVPKIGKSLRSIVEKDVEDDEEEEESCVDVYCENGKEEVSIESQTFIQFCKTYGVQENGRRNVMIKFFLHRHNFLREKAARKKLDLETDWPVVPILEDYDLDRKNKGKDDVFAKDVLEKSEAVAYDLGRYRYAIVLPMGEKNLREIHIHERPGILQVREFLCSVGMGLKKLHGQSITHGNVRMDNIVRLSSSKLSLISLSSAYIPNDSSSALTDYVAGSTHKFSSGYLPPEMICKIDVMSQHHLLERYERYWKSVSDDAKDLKLLTPDDIQIISSVLKTLLAREDPTKEDQDEADEEKNEEKNETKNASMPTISTLTSPTAFPKPNPQEWKDILSLGLITISFDDLPHSLTCCKTIREFSTVWTRLLSNSHLWEIIKPRFSEDGFTAYLIKSFQQEIPTSPNGEITPLNPTVLPYNLVRATPKLDIWAFGILTFTLCSSSHPLFVDSDSNLHNSSFPHLHTWNKKFAEKLIHEQIDDPLAQDLLLQMLLPEEDRLGNMDDVLGHPFFGPASDLEAQWILEKHEEQQLMLEETTIIPKVTTETQKRLENSTEKQCKIVFEEEKIVVPTCLIILPYELNLAANGMLVVPTSNLDQAIRAGKHLLDINKATARLSFWLMMKKNMAGNDGQNFKGRLKDWLKRARTEPGEHVAKEIVKAIGCGDEYILLCREMLEKGDAVSQAKSYIKDPMGAARVAIRQSTEMLIKCFASQTQYLFLVDEYNGAPVLGENEGRMHTNITGEEDNVFPIRIDPNTRHLQNLFLPFINITVMAVTAVNGLASLKKLLGLPNSHPIPETWKDGEPGLVHKLDSPSSVAEFAVLQDVVRKQDRQAGVSTNNLDYNVSARSCMSTWSETTLEEGSEMTQLEVFFREYDPMRMFSGLRRVSDGKGHGSAIWTTEDVVKKIQGEVELATVETKLRELKKELAKQDKIQQEINKLTEQVKMLKKMDSLDPLERGGQEGARTPGNNETNALEKSNSAFRCFQDYANPNSVFLNRNGENSSQTDRRKRIRRNASKKSKFRVRPYFGKC